MAKSNEWPEPPDHEYRKRIATELDRTLLVEAAAGTGKTTCLITRMIALLREGKCGVETLAAVTFTRKAAAELRTRFQLALERAARASSGKERERLDAALARVERCFIGTIHSFCARLLRERPVEAGVNPNFAELDEMLDAQLREQAWREHVAALIATDAPIVPELERLGLKISPATRRASGLASELDELGLAPAELGPAFIEFAKYLDVDEWPAEPRPLPDLGPCIEELQEYIAHMRSLKLPSDPGNDKLMPRYELICRMAKIAPIDADQPAPLMEILEQFKMLRPGEVVQRNWPGKKPQAVAERARWNTFTERYAEPLLLAWREHRYEPVMRAIRPAREIYNRLRRERNALNFQDLLLRSAELLRDKPPVRRYFRERFTHILVDEFQDTDPIQAEVMLLLAADDPAEQNWQACRPVPGALFVVGDPKQSIYRFRRADILTYNKFRAIVEATGGETIPLTANFRSTAPLVNWVNGCFSGIFPPAADDFNPADRPLDVGRNGAADEDSPVQRLTGPASLTNQDDVAKHEADLIARTIRRAIDEKLPVPRTEAERRLGLPDHAQPGDFLIVARTKHRLTTYARKLQQYGLPHAVTGGSVLNEVPELELLRTCLAAVVRPDNPVALVAALRSELFGVADTVLYDFRRRGGVFSYHAELPPGLPSPDAGVLQDAFERLQTYARRLRRMPAAAAIEWIAADLGLIARACASEDGEAHAGSLLKAIELLRAADGSLTAGDYLDALDRIANQDETHDGIPVTPSREAPVRVMNLHQCKGLEAPWVFLADPAGNGDHLVGIHIDRSADRPRGYLPIYGPKRSQWGARPLLAHPPGWESLAEHEQQFLDAEANRLLYVAATRAGVRLVISQRDGKGNQKNPWRAFEADLQGAGEAPDPGPAATPPAAEASFDPAEWRREVEAIEDRWRRVATPTFAVQAVKESALLPGMKPHGEAKGGAEWGAVLHRLLEAAMKQPRADLRGLALSVLEDEELPTTHVDEVVATVQRVTNSDLWRRAHGAQRWLAEASLGTLRKPASPNDPPAVLRGVIDLVFREPQGWVIADYKTERVEAKAVPALVDYYRPQIEAYADVWQAIVGEPVVERGLFFTHTGSYVTL